MAVETYSRVEDVLQHIEDPDDTVDDADLGNAIEKGHEIMSTNIGRYFEQQKRVFKIDENDDLIRTVELKFKPVLKVNEILIHGNEVVPTGKYTVNKEAGTITFDQSWWDDNADKGTLFVFKYVPKIYQQIEAYWAAQWWKNNELIQMEDSEKVALEVNARRQAKMLENRVNKMSGPGTATDGTVRRGTP